MSWTSTPAQGRSSFFLNWSFEHPLNSSSRVLDETIGKWILLMWGVGKLSGAVITDKITKLKIAYRCSLLLHNCNNNKMRPCVTFSGIKKKLLIRLRSSTFVYTRLVTRLHSPVLVWWLIYTRLHLSTFVCDSSTFVYTLLHSSSDSSVFLE